MLLFSKCFPDTILLEKSALTYFLLSCVASCLDLGFSPAFDYGLLGYLFACVVLSKKLRLLYLSDRRYFLATLPSLPQNIHIETTWTSFRKPERTYVELVYYVILVITNHNLTMTNFD